MCKISLNIFQDNDTFYERRRVAARARTRVLAHFYMITS